jgi:hypothetical protein
VPISAGLLAAESFIWPISVFSQTAQATVKSLRQSA